MAYCEPTDLILGDTRLPTSINAQEFVNEAADEIDAAIGYYYITPIVVDDNPVNRPTTLLLKTINRWLASGRLILTLSRTGEDNTLDALGKYYVNMAVARINDICSNKITLIGAQQTDQADSFKGPVIANAEPVSLVDAFYGHFNTPSIGYPLPPDSRAYG